MTGRNGPWRGKTIQVVGDLSLDEQRWLYRKTRELKEAIRDGCDLSRYRIDDGDYAVHLVFLENSTRTRESFLNAARFHRVRVNRFDVGTSSFQKNESISDTAKMLVGYAPESCFVVRSKLEGTCRALEDSIGDYCGRAGFPRAAFINAGDGRHEHPTQEFLDELSFLEQLGWNEDHIHLALVGDLWHGRTVHSKADGLKVFRNVEVDLVAPELLRMPERYVERMEANGFSVRVFENLDEYLAQGRVAPAWYFTRLQLERMGDTVLEQAPRLRRAVTFRQDLLGRLPEGTRFYHPLPRDRLAPTIPTFLDTLPLNGWDLQSANGYYTRIIELGMVSGLLGEDFEGERALPAAESEDFVREAPIVRREKPEHKVGIKPVANGIVIDHIASGRPVDEIWNRVDAIRRILALNVRSSHGVYHSNAGPELFKGIVSLPDILAFDRKDLKKLAAISPGCTLNMVKDGEVVRKYRLAMPPRIYNFDEISCRNPNCVSHPGHKEGVPPEFRRVAGERFACRWCEAEHAFSEIWNLGN